MVEQVPPKIELTNDRGNVQLTAVSEALNGVKIGSASLRLEDKLVVDGSTKFVMFGSVGDNRVAIYVPKEAVSRVHMNGYSILESLTREDLGLPMGYRVDDNLWKKIDRTSYERAYPAAITTMTLGGKNNQELPICIVERAEGKEATPPTDETLLPRYLRLLGSGMSYFTRLNRMGKFGVDLEWTKVDRFNVDLDRGNIRVLDQDNDSDKGPHGKVITQEGQTRTLALLMYRACGGFPGSVSEITENQTKAAQKLFIANLEGNFLYYMMHPILARYFDAMFFKFDELCPKTPEQLGQELFLLESVFRSKSERDKLTEIIANNASSLPIKSAVAEALEDLFPEGNGWLIKEIENKAYGGYQAVVEKRRGMFLLQRARYRSHVLSERVNRLEFELREMRKENEALRQAGGKQT